MTRSPKNDMYLSNPSLPPEETEHQKFVGYINRHFTNPRVLIADGVHPFKAWREEMGEEEHVLAQAIGTDAMSYMEIEEGLKDATGDQLIRFCKHFSLSLADLSGDNQPLTPLLRDTMLKSLDGETNDIERTRNYARLHEDARPKNSLKKMLSTCKFEGNSSHMLIVTGFLGMLLRDDGSQTLRFNGADSVIDTFTEQLDITQKKLQEKHQKACKYRDNRWQEQNRLGGILYREEPTWREAWSLLNKYRCRNSDRAMLHFYKTDPVSIGRREWPTTLIDYRDESGKDHGSWKSGHQHHVAMLDRYLTEVLPLTTRTEKALTDFQKQRRSFNVWSRENEDLLSYFYNRQVIMAHSDFSHLRPTSPPIPLPKRGGPS